MKHQKIVIFSIVLVAFFLCFTIPINKTEKITEPAILLTENNEFVKTTLCFSGKWNSKNIFSLQDKYTGKIIIDYLEYTSSNETWDSSFILEPYSNSSILRADYVYNSASNRPIGSALIFTNVPKDAYVISTHKVNDSKNYIIVAPATTIDEVYVICKQFGLTSLLPNNE